jgi:hypothetical protein
MKNLQASKINVAPSFRHDLAHVAERLKRYFRGCHLKGYLPGKTRIRNGVMHIYEISAARAEEIVDDMHAHGFVRYAGDPTRPERAPRPWVIDPAPIGTAT